MQIKLRGRSWNYQFQEKKFEDVSFAHGTTQAIFDGSFLYTSHSTPSNFSAFCFTQQAPFHQNQQARGVTLHLISAHGQTQSVGKILKLTKQVITVPKKYHEMGNQIAYFKGGAEIFFGNSSPLATGLKNFINDLESNCQVFMDATAMDEPF